MLEVNCISKTFGIGTPNEKNALSNVSLSMKEKDFITIIGGNGAGKSTLLNAVAGRFHVDHGSILIDDEDVTSLPEFKRAKYIGRVFQDPRMGTATNMSIEENMAMALRRGKSRSLKLGITRAERSKYMDYLEMLDLGLEDRMSAKTGLLSGGQRQALTLLMATMTKPKLLLLDEHTAALDPKTAKKVLELTKKIAEDDNLTSIMITHNMKDALRHGNRLIMMHEGNIVADINAEQKKTLQVSDLMDMFEEAGGAESLSDKMLLS